MGTFDGKVAFITGIARAQGRSHALRLASGGADIIGVDIGEDIPGLHYHLASHHDLHETIELIEGTGRRAIIRQADVRDLDSLSAAVNDGVAELGRLDIVVANAGIFSLGAATELGDRAWQDVLDVNLTGAWHTAKATVPHIAAGGRGGSIIFVSSMAALRPPLGLAHYSASKAGVVALMKTLAAELGRRSRHFSPPTPTGVSGPCAISPSGVRSVGWARASSARVYVSQTHFRSGWSRPMSTASTSPTRSRQGRSRTSSTTWCRC